MARRSTTAAATAAVVAAVCTLLHAHPVVAASADDRVQPGTGEFFIFLFSSLVLILVAGLMSGLTVGYMSLDKLNIEILKKTGTGPQRKQAASVAGVIENHNLLLVTLVLANSAAAQTLPIFFDRITPTYVAILLSVTAILFFGEILPQAVCTGRPQAAQ